MNGYCRTLDCFFGSRFDPSEGTWDTIKVYRDGNPIKIGGPFGTEEEAEDCASAVRAQELADNGQFGVGA